MSDKIPSKLNTIDFVDVKLQKLTIPAGWCIDLNKFYCINPDTSLVLKNHPLDFGLFEAFFESSLFTAKHLYRKKLVDLSWIPMWDENGQYELEVYHLIEKTHKIKKRENPYTLSESVFSFSSRNREEIVEVLEKVLFSLAINKPING